nr:hypothetical protein [uncultured Mediterraneibacter sp.]
MSCSLLFQYIYPESISFYASFSLLFRPELITLLISSEDARFGLNASRPSS